MVVIGGGTGGISILLGFSDIKINWTKFLRPHRTWGEGKMSRGAESAMLKTFWAGAGGVGMGVSGRWFERMKATIEGMADRIRLEGVDRRIDRDRKEGICNYVWGGKQ